MIKNDPKIIIPRHRKNVNQEKFGPRKLKKYIATNPNSINKTPPISSHFQATKSMINKINQGNAFILLRMIPFIPPP